MIAAILMGLSTVMFKRSLVGRTVTSSLRTGWFWLGGVLAVLTAIAFTYQLESTDLSTAVPMLSVSYLVIVPLSVFWLKEKVGSRELLGIAMILMGAVLL